MNYDIFTPCALEIRNFILNTSLHNTYQKSHNHSYFIFSISSMTHQITFLYLFIYFWNYKEHQRSNPSTSLLSSTTSKTQLQSFLLKTTEGASQLLWLSFVLRHITRVICPKMFLALTPPLVIPCICQHPPSHNGHILTLSNAFPLCLWYS